MRRLFKRLAVAAIVILLLVTAGIWWLLAYIAPEEQLDMSYTSIRVGEKALNAIKSFKPELVLTEADINSLIKMNLNSELAKHVRLDGARFELNGDRLIAYLNVMYRERIPFQLYAEYEMEWQDPNLVLWPQALKMKSIDLPHALLKKITVPLDLPESLMIALDKVQFESNQIRVTFRLDL